MINPVLAFIAAAGFITPSLALECGEQGPRLLTARELQEICKGKSAIQCIAKGLDRYPARSLEKSVALGCGAFVSAGESKRGDESIAKSAYSACISGGAQYIQNYAEPDFRKRGAAGLKSNQLLQLGLLQSICITMPRTPSTRKLRVQDREQIEMRSDCYRKVAQNAGGGLADFSKSLERSVNVVKQLKRGKCNTAEIMDSDSSVDVSSGQESCLWTQLGEYGRQLSQ